MSEQSPLFPAADPAIDALKSAVVGMLTKAAEEIRPCRACGEKLYFIRHYGTGALCPYDGNSVPHFTNCPHPERFSRAGRKEATDGK